MPSIHRTDEFEQCMEIYENDALYCVVGSYIQPDLSSNLYNFISSYSSNKKQHFRHDKLQRGLCINICSRLITELGNISENYLVKSFPMDSKVKVHIKVLAVHIKLFSEIIFLQLIHQNILYQNAIEDRAMYDDLVNMCVNFELDEYNLTAYSSIEYCIRREQRIAPGIWKFSAKNFEF